MSSNFFTSIGKIAPAYIKTIGGDAANILNTINAKINVRDDIIDHTNSIIDEKVITAISPTHYNLDMSVGSHAIHLSYTNYKDAHRAYGYIRLLIIAAIEYHKDLAKSVGNIVLVRYSTETDSWISPYVDLSVAITHIKKNVRIQFGEWDEQKVIAADIEIDRVIDMRGKDIEIDTMCIEIEYGEPIITE